MKSIKPDSCLEDEDNESVRIRAFVAQDENTDKAKPFRAYVKKEEDLTEPKQITRAYIKKDDQTD